MSPPENDNRVFKRLDSTTPDTWRACVIAEISHERRISFYGESYSPDSLVPAQSENQFVHAGPCQWSMEGVAVMLGLEKSA